MNFLDVALVILAFAYVAAMIRIARGPSDADRAVGADLAYFILIAGVVLIAVRMDEPAFFDVAIVATFVGFLASVTLAGLLDRHRRRSRRRSRL